MKEYTLHTPQEQPSLQLKPILSYPRTAQTGETYLITIDVQLAEGSPWPYQEEEFEISFLLETTPFFTHEPLGEHEPGIVLHRFGGTYGPAEYLLTASEQEVAAGEIKIALLNGWGLPIAQLKLECEVKQEVPGTTKQKVTIQEKKETLSTDRLLITTSIRKDLQQELISKQLVQVGWNIYDRSIHPLQQEVVVDISIPEGNVAVLGYPEFENEYILCIDREIIGIVTVNVAMEWHISSNRLPPQSKTGQLVNSNILPWRSIYLSNGKSGKVLLDNSPFIYSTRGDRITFTNFLEPGRRSRNVYTFHQPATLALWLKQAVLSMPASSATSFRASLRSIPTPEQGGLYDYQFEALQQIEQALSKHDPRILIQIETNRGKTHTAVNSIYRLLRYTHARHILYIVDTPIAAEYAFDAFQKFIVPGDNQKFTGLYNVSLIGEEKLDPSVHVYIGRLENLYNLYSSGSDGEYLPQPIINHTSEDAVGSFRGYCADLPIEYFDVIFLAESEYIYYQTWQPILDYFDAFYIGIASDLSSEVLNFFKNNAVYPAGKIDEDLQKKQAADALLIRQKQLSVTIKNVRKLLGSDDGLSYEIDRLSQLIWLLFLKCLDDFEKSQEELLGDDYVPIIAKGYRWREWTVAIKQQPYYELRNFVDHLYTDLGHMRGEDDRDIRTIIGNISRENHNHIRSDFVLIKVVDLLNTINFNASTDLFVISDIYEILLKEMRDIAGDAGEFYTPRPIVRFIIDCIRPQLGESILDPACGTAGFLVATYAKLAHQIKTPEQRKQLMDNLIGIEKKPMPYMLAIMTMLLYGLESPNIIQHNALTPYLLQQQDKDHVDVIITNPPFGGEEDPYIVDKFSRGIHTRDTALLLVEYIMTTLKHPGGRCAIVLPNSFLFRKSATGAIRRHLLLNFNLHTIVRLPAGVFSPYTGIPTNILFFEASEEFNNADTQNTKAVWYYEIPLPEGRRSYSKTKPIQYADFHDCLTWWDNREENEHAWQVTVKQLMADDCNLDCKNPRRQKNT